MKAEEFLTHQRPHCVVTFVVMYDVLSLVEGQKKVQECLMKHDECKMDLYSCEVCVYVLKSV